MSLYDVIIIGGGIAGLATAAALRRRGVANVLILERASALRPVGAAIGLFPHGLAALEQVSPAALDGVISSAIPIKTSVMRDADSGAVLSAREVPRSSSGTHPNLVFTVWYQLQGRLREAVPEESLWLGATAATFVEEDDGVTVEGSRAGERFSVRARVVVGADGIRSAVRESLWGERALNYHGVMALQSCVDVRDLDEGMCPPAGESVRYACGEAGKVFGVRETSPGIATVTAVVKSVRPVFAGDADARKARMRELFSGYPEAVRHVIERTPSSAVLENAIYDIEVVEGWSKGRVVLVGDAAHAMTPAWGQGANMGLEDAAELSFVLAPLLKEKNLGKEELCEVLLRFWKARRERVCAVHAVSREKGLSISNQSKETVPSAEEEQEEEQFLQKLYGWKPSTEPPLVGA